MWSGRALALGAIALAIVACGPQRSTTGTLPPLPRATSTLAPLTSVDDTTIENSPLTVSGGQSVEFFGRSAPGATIEVIAALPACSGGTRGQTARSVVPADGNYRVVVRTEPHWTRLDVEIRFVSKDGTQTLISDVKTVTILPVGRTPYCAR